MQSKHYILALIMVLTINVKAQKPVDFATMDTKKINSDPSLVWTQFGPGGSGNNYHLYWHPTDPDLVFQGPNMGNSYRSTNRGETYESILDEDGPGYKTRKRGPIEIYTPEFSRQNPNFGICTIEDASMIYVTRDKGKSWKISNKITKQFKDIHVNTIAVDPKDDKIWYAGSGHVRDCNHFFFSYERPHGVHGNKNTIGTAVDGVTKNYNHKAIIWKSVDKGQTWKEVTPKGIYPEAQITRLMVHPEKTKTVYAATTYGFYKSTDGGKTWKEKTNTGLDNDIIRSMDMHYDAKTKKTTLYVVDLVKYIPDRKTVKYNGGIFKSTDEGESWTNVTANMPLEKALLKSYFIKRSYYKIALGKWFRKTEKEAMTLYPELPEKMLQSFSMVRVNPSNPDHVLVVNNYKSQFTFAGGMLWRTDNGGKDWYVTLRNGKEWEGKDKALWEARNNPTAHNADWVGQDEWENRDAYDRKAGATVEFNCDGSTIMYQVAKVVCVSEDNGDSWLENDEKATVPGGHNWVGAGNSNLPGEEIIQDERLKNTLYLCSGENTIWKTTNDGDKVRPGGQAVYKLSMPHKEDPDECSVSTMAIHPDDVNTMYALHFRQAFFGKLMKSTDGGTNWKPQGELFNPKEFGNPVRMSIHQNHLTLDPNNPEKIYCVIARKHINDVVKCNPGKFKAFGVYRSLDGGANFKVINNGLPKGGDVQKLALDPHHKGDLLAAVSGTTNKPGGLYRLKNGSNSWVKETTPAGMVSVHDVFFSQDNRLYVSGGSLTGKDSEGGVWYSEKGKDWEQVFPYKYTNHIRVAKYDANVLMVSVTSNGRDVLNPGIYRSQDKGKTWFKVNTGNLQSDRLNDLEIDYYNKGIYWCSTYGAGYYKGVDKSQQ